MNDTQKKGSISRREFFAALVPVFSVPAVLWWLFTGKREMGRVNTSKAITISNKVPAGISFHEGVILIRKGNNIRAFEGKCTHLGCHINRFEGDELVCKCHGSRFNSNGEAIKGPAIESLKEFTVKDDLVNAQLIIRKPS